MKLSQTAEKSISLILGCVILSLQYIDLARILTAMGTFLYMHKYAPISRYESYPFLPQLFSQAEVRQSLSFLKKLPEKLEAGP